MTERATKATTGAAAATCERQPDPGTVGIIIPTYGHFDYAVRAVRSAREHTPDTKILVIDDGSPDCDIGVACRLYDAGASLFHEFKHTGNLSQSWNRGLQLCRGRLEYAVCANSDVVFSPRWWDGMHHGLCGFDFVGPMTNAAGHSFCQQATYAGGDTEDSIAGMALRLSCESPPRLTDRLNGFCFAGRTESFFRYAHDPAAGDVFNSAIPLAGNEDDFFRRAQSAGARLAVVPSSFVFHYRGVSRGIRGTPGRGLNRGAYRRAEKEKAAT